MWATGDAARSENAQDIASPNGKILRLNIDGSIPPDNPDPSSMLWAFGFRNMQGLVFSKSGKLYTSEHGDATDDEVNLIRKQGNYGWPVVQGFADVTEEISFHTKTPIVEPLKAWTPTIAPAGIDYYDSEAIPEWRNSILLTTLKAQSFLVLKLNRSGTSVVSEKIYLDKLYGRLRDICVSPSGDIYVATSNRDWNPAEGFPKENDDRIIKISKVKKIAPAAAVKSKSRITKAPAVAKAKSVPKGLVLYGQYCASCHKNDGNGIAGTFPPLKGAEQVTGNKDVLVKILLRGLSGQVKVKGKVYDQQMPSFSFLADKDIADVLTYIRSSWGNRSAAVQTEDVFRNRKQGGR
jgi:mono/diheme cytochrome c family protein